MVWLGWRSTPEHAPLLQAGTPQVGRGARATGMRVLPEGPPEGAGTPARPRERCDNAAFDPVTRNVRGQSGPSSRVTVLVATAVETVSGGRALAGPPGVERSLAGFRSGRCAPCLSYGGRHPAAFLFTMFYMQIHIYTHI